MNRQLTIVSLLLLFFSSAALAASSCVAFDISWNLLAFGLDGKDYNAGTKDSWASGSAKNITTSGRPPFDGTNTTCYLSQFYNAIYVLNADSSNPSNIYIYNAASSSWSTQTVTTGNFDVSDFVAILDHDTNIFYALSKGELYSLDMGSLTAANSTSLSWNDIEAPSFTTTGYNPVMALAQNHIHFLDVPGNAAGTANIFVIHYSYFQPEVQSYGNNSFPASHGQATSFFMDSGVQEDFAFIPDDGSATYVVSVETNTTQTLAGPSTKDSGATYFASTDSLVQLTSDGAVSYISYSNSSTEANTAATWSTVANLASVAPASSSAASSTTSKTGTSSAKGAASTSTGTGSSSNGAESAGVAIVSLGVTLMAGSIGMLLL
ncbi:uncharacterized protein BT62DRAFT_1005135 [Guyanagaster necrorhizus]|uniref:Uncharacterized protein n=1 Tax=Guyanagaster necrorhizus TaxID=856835 RepID=A0A9P7VTP5_9AGAR|nr:uncharacterized protein BT62DRAFT_1005135 [Guyanagaster necrorhizus MCA 3950]KAG7446754.1 hypothetical protein BT62DRAFT_1005135 [Guyanagaster necrorhizus MCA 3950]